MRKILLCTLWLGFFILATPPVHAAETLPVIPGLTGFGVDTPAGRGGQVIVVTTLAAEGPGSLREAIDTKGPRTIVFEVGGVIDLNGKSLVLTEPFITIAGQTAPEPGITLIKGEFTIFSHDVLIQHLHVRPGDMGNPARSGWEPDGINIGSSHNVVIDHCSISWAIDENLSASGPRHQGREATSHDITFSHCIIAEGLRNASHEEGAHSMGSLIHDHVRNVAIIGNLYACNVNRNPVLKPDASAAIVNNLIYDPGQHAIHTYWPIAEYKGQPAGPVPCEMAAVGNVLQHGPDTWPWVAILSIEQGKARIYQKDNIAFSVGTHRLSPPHPNWTPLDAPSLWPEGLTPLPSDQVADDVLTHAGARSAERDPIDARIIEGVRQKSGRIIDTQEKVGGYPAYTPTHRPLTLPANPNDIDTSTGYTNLESWLHTEAVKVELP